MIAVHPYLNFVGETEEAFAFYRQVFGGDYLGVVRYRDFPDNPMGLPESELDLIANIALPVTPAVTLMGNDVPATFKPITMGNNFFITIETETGAEADRLYEALSEGGGREMPLERTAWAEKYGLCRDRFGVQWMIMYAGDARFEPPTNG